MEQQQYNENIIKNLEQGNVKEKINTANKNEENNEKNVVEKKSTKKSSLKTNSGAQPRTNCKLKVSFAKNNEKKCSKNEVKNKNSTKKPLVKTKSTPQIRLKKSGIGPVYLQGINMCLKKRWLKEKDLIGIPKNCKIVKVASDEEKKNNKLMRLLNENMNKKIDTPAVLKNRDQILKLLMKNNENMNKKIDTPTVLKKRDPDIERLSERFIEQLSRGKKKNQLYATSSCFFPKIASKYSKEYMMYLNSINKNSYWAKNKNAELERLKKERKKIVSKVKLSKRDTKKNFFVKQ